MHDAKHYRFNYMRQVHFACVCSNDAMVERNYMEGRVFRSSTAGGYNNYKGFNRTPMSIKELYGSRLNEKEPHIFDRSLKEDIAEAKKKVEKILLELKPYMKARISTMNLHRKEPTASIKNAAPGSILKCNSKKHEIKKPKTTRTHSKTLLAECKALENKLKLLQEKHKEVPNKQYIHVVINANNRTYQLEITL
eukprot:TRINITY_DN3565_c0_g1_i1.p1 TRINITY_DN3565_c0_g1~~TRINITY_DN3565_c0_g1_i1.p1  ORF type:complete len:194 (-),score=16.68 TRINITY_DN3565_c0_g1_i1:375-956(-)